MFALDKLQKRVEIIRGYGIHAVKTIKNLLYGRESIVEPKHVATLWIETERLWRKARHYFASLALKKRKFEAYYVVAYIESAHHHFLITALFLQFRIAGIQQIAHHIRLMYATIVKKNLFV